ncbi:hypothetical protein Ahy_A01g000476 [Arachis hypogaea]|uniref:Uncharacterized protein n=1 Tax=Arachis hypogaea TaxID=3818 RepID=A0A445EK97_ARAHY|nr:hypothetical protein Ahy_A01g000476 [Arachis hypogaea]
MLRTGSGLNPPRPGRGGAGTRGYGYCCHPYVTRVFHENGLSVSRVDIEIEGDNAVGSFFVTDCSSQQVNPNIAELVRQVWGRTLVTDHKSLYRVPKSSSSSLSAMDETTNNLVAKAIVFIGNMLWSQIESPSGSFGLLALLDPEN